MAVGRKSVVILTTQVLGAIMGAIALAFIGRFVTPGDMGRVAYALGLSGLVAGFAQAGLGQAHIKKVHEDHALDACHGALFWLRTRLSLIVFGAAMALFVIYHFWRGFQDTTIWLIAIAIAYRAIVVYRSSYVASFQAWQQTARAQMVPLIDTVVRAPAVILVAVLLALRHIEHAPYWIAGTYAVGAVAGLLLAIRWFRSSGYHIGKSSPELRRSYLEFGLPLAFSAIITQWILQLDTVMIGFFGTAADVGSYFAASRIIQMALMFPVALGLLLLPQFARSGQLRVAAGTAARRLALLMVPGFMVLMLYPNEVLRIAVGGRYTDAADALRWLAAFGILSALRVIPLTTAKATNVPRVALIASLINLISNGVLNAAFIPKSVLGMQTLGLGIEGAALASLASQAIALAYILWTQRDHMQWSFVPVTTFVGALAFTWNAVPLAWVQSPDRIWELGAVSVAFYTASWALLRAFNLLTKEDTALAGDAMHPRKFLHYIRDELRFRPPS